MSKPTLFLDGRVSLYAGDCLDVLPTLEAESVDSVVCDPPYHLTSIVKRFGAENAAPAQHGTDGAFARASRGFMGKQWDGGDVAFRIETWAAILRVLKPGAHLVAFSGTRTYHRMVCAIEDAGFEIRDQIAWTFGSGFPKSHNAGNGWGTALKPAWEPIVLARKPLIGTVVANVLKHGTGALNIDGCRIIGTSDKLGGGDEKAETAGQFTNDGWRRPWMDDPEAREAFAAKVRSNVAKSEALGRWPANLVLSYPEDEYELRPFTSTEQKRELYRWLSENA